MQSGEAAVEYDSMLFVLLMEVRHVKRLIAVLGMVVAIALGVGSSALATGQPGAPNVTCGTGNATSQPPGFLKSGFLNTADAHYAGNGAPSLNANSGNAIAQYDVACLQLTQH